MFTLLTDTGKAQLQALSGSNRIKISKYEIGILLNPTDLTDVAANPATVFLEDDLDTKFTAVFEDDYTKIMYSERGETKSLFKMFVPQDYQYFKFNCVVIYAKVGSSEFPFLVSYNLVQNPKLSTEINRYGMRYFFMLQLDLDNRNTTYDFTNLQYEAPDFQFFDQNYFTPEAFRIKQDQIIIENHILVPQTYGVFAVESEDQFWGVLLQPWSAERNVQNFTMDGEQLTLDGEDLVLDVSPNRSNVVLTGIIDPQYEAMDGTDFVLDEDNNIIVVDPPKFVLFSEGDE